MLRLPARKARIFRLFLLSYLLVFLLPFVVGLLFSNRILMALRDQTIESRQVQLDHGRDELDKRLSDLDLQAVQLAMRPKIAAILLASDSGQASSIYRVRDAWLDLSAATFPGDLVESFFVYYRKKGILMSRDAVYIRLSLLDTSLFSFNGEDFLSWQSSIGAAETGTQFLPSATITFGEKKVPALTYVRPIPLGQRDASQGSLLIFVRKDALLKAMSPADEPDVSSYVVDSSGGIIASSSPGVSANLDLPLSFPGRSGSLVRKTGGENTIYLHTTLPGRGWTLVSAFPERSILVKARRLRALIYAVSAFLLALGGGGAYALAYWSSKPAQDIVRRLRTIIDADTGGGANEYELLDGMVNGLIEKSRNLGDTLQRQVPFLRQTYFEKLYAGGFANREEEELVRTLGGVDLGARWYCVLLIQVAGYDGARTKEALEATHLSRVLIKDAFISRLGCAGRLSEAEADTLALLVASDSAEAEGCPLEAEGIAKRMRELARSDLGVLVNIAGGGPVDDPLHLYRSYQEARHALGQPWSGISTDAILWEQDNPKADSDYWYPIDVESRIMNLTRAGSGKEVSGLLDRIYRQNFDERALSDDMKHALYSELRGTIIKLTAQLSPRGDVRDADAEPRLASAVREIETAAVSESAPLEVFSIVRRAYEILCSMLVEQKKSHNESLKQRILAHINDSYRDPGLCLRSVADVFGLNDIYLSQFFKEQTGENFHRYLENLRLSEARELLKRPDIAVSDVARVVGYASPGTFRKALRRSDGASPTELRQRDETGPEPLSPAKS